VSYFLVRLLAPVLAFGLLRAAAVWAAEEAGAKAASGPPRPADLAQYVPTVGRLIQAATNSDFGFQRLAVLCDTFGPRLSGSTNLEGAIDWMLGEMQRDGLENVRGEEVWVPHWVRGRESLELLTPAARPIKLLGLGGSVGTPPEGIVAEVLVVKDFGDLQARRDKAKGRIVLFNQPFTSYERTVNVRMRGAIEAAKAGAVASLIRSVTPFSMRTVHTGAMRYEEGLPRIPHAAISVEDAALLQRMQDRGERVVVGLKMEARTLPDARSRNVLAEVLGREKPDELVLVSGHLDSWDVGQGAMDDAGGCLAAWEAARLMRKLDLRPRRTVRVVCWVNEENGFRGARTYQANHRQELDQHLLAIESDEGVFRPLGFGFSGGDAAWARVRGIGSLLSGIQAGEITRGAGGGAADLRFLQQAGVPIMELRVDGPKYFWFHHTEADTMDKLSRDEFNLCVAALAVMSYVAADLPERLPR
jgi:carboxypeptidase Q